MDKNIKDGLEGMIVRAIREMTCISPGSDEYDDMVDNIVKLYELKLSEDESVKDRQKNFHDNIYRYIALGVDAIGIVLPLIFYGCWMRRGLEFEQEGTFTSTTFKGLINKFRPVK